MHLLFKTAIAALLFAACNQAAPTPEAPRANDAAAILKHKYWVSKSFNEALFAKNIIDTLSYLPCSELVFLQKDTILFTSCLSDAGRCAFKPTGPASMEFTMEGIEGKVFKAEFDEKSGVMHVQYPAGEYADWPTDFIPHDDVDTRNIDLVTINLGRKRLAGTYAALPEKGQAATTAMLELRADGTQSGLGDFDLYEPWPAGIGGGSVMGPALNVIYLVKKGREEQPVLGWQLHGDTLRLWETKNIAPDGDMQEYKPVKLKGIYVKK